MADASAVRGMVKHYGRADEVTSHVVNTVRRFDGLRPHLDTWTYDDGRQQVLLALTGVVPVHLRQGVYNCPLALYLPFEFPAVPPITLVRPNAAMNIKRPNRYVDPNGNVSVGYLSEWERKAEGRTLEGLVEMLQAEFGQDYPLVAIVKRAPTATANPTPPPRPPSQQQLAQRPPPPPTGSPQLARPPPPPGMSMERPPSRHLDQSPPHPYSTTPAPPSYVPRQPPQPPNSSQAQWDRPVGEPYREQHPPLPPNGPRQEDPGHARQISFTTSPPPGFPPGWTGAQNMPPPVVSRPPPPPPGVSPVPASIPNGSGAPVSMPPHFPPGFMPPGGGPPPPGFPLGPPPGRPLSMHMPPGPPPASVQARPASTYAIQSPEVQPQGRPASAYSMQPPEGVPNGHQSSPQHFQPSRSTGPPPSAHPPPPMHAQNMPPQQQQPSFPPQVHPQAQPPVQQPQVPPPVQQTSPAPTRQPGERRGSQPLPPAQSSVPKSPPQQQQQPPRQYYAPSTSASSHYLPSISTTRPNGRPQDSSDEAEDSTRYYPDSEDDRSPSSPQGTSSMFSYAPSTAAPPTIRSPSPPRDSRRKPVAKRTKDYYNGDSEEDAPAPSPFQPSVDPRSRPPAQTRAPEQAQRQPVQRYQQPAQPYPPPPPVDQQYRRQPLSRLVPPKKATPSIMDSPDDDTPAPIPVPQQAAPRRPINPEILAIRTRLHAKLSTTYGRLASSTEHELSQLDVLEEDLLKGEPAIVDEMQRLEAVRTVCQTVRDRYLAVVQEGEKRLGELEARGEGPQVDEIVCSSTVVYNQLLDLVAEDAALEDTIYQLGRGLNTETANIDLDQFLKRVRSLARQQFLVRATINKTLTMLEAAQA